MISIRALIYCTFLLISVYSHVNAANHLWCCQIEVPSKPFFNEQGHLLGYQPQLCPQELQICCKGQINILGTCITLELANQLLPHWQALAEQQGISLAEAIAQMGVVVG